MYLDKEVIFEYSSHVDLDLDLEILEGILPLWDRENLAYFERWDILLATNHLSLVTILILIQKF